MVRDYLWEFLYVWFAFSPAAPRFHLSLSHDNSLSPSFLPVHSPCKSKGPTSIYLANGLGTLLVDQKQFGTRTLSVWTCRFLIWGARLIQGIRSNPQHGPLHAGSFLLHLIKQLPVLGMGWIVKGSLGSG